MTSATDPLGLVGTTIAGKYAIESVFTALGEVAEDQREKLLQDFIQQGALLADRSEKSGPTCSCGSFSVSRASQRKICDLLCNISDPAGKAKSSDQLHRLGSGTRGLRATRRTPSHRGGVGVRRARGPAVVGAAFVPVPRRAHRPQLFIRVSLREIAVNRMQPAIWVYA